LKDSLGIVVKKKITNYKFQVQFFYFASSSLETASSNFFSNFSIIFRKSSSVSGLFPESHFSHSEITSFTKLSASSKIFLFFSIFPLSHPILSKSEKRN